MLRQDALALGIAFLLFVIGVAGLADRYVDPSGQLLRDSANAAERLGTYRFSTFQEYGGTYAQSQRTPAGLRLNGAVDLHNMVTRADTVITLGSLTVTCTYLTVDDQFYVSVHPSRQAAIGASWLRTRVGGLLARSTIQGVRPDQLDEEAAGLFRDLEPAGRAVIRSVRTTKYVGTVDVAALAGSSARTPAVTQVGRKLPVEVYIDDDGLLRRIAIEIRAGEEFSVRFTTDRFDYGKPVDIKAPPASGVKPANPRDFGVACYPTSFPGGLGSNRSGTAAR